MLRLSLLIALSAPPGPSEPSCPAQPDRAFLGAIVTNPAYQGRVVETCGLVQGVGDRGPNERVLHDSSRHTGYWLYVSDAGNALPAEGTRACIVGTYRPRDGLTPEEARARGVHNSMVVDGLQRPDWVFYPLRCTYNGPTLG